MLKKRNNFSYANLFGLPVREKNDLKLSPFFTFYGGKWRASPRYPQPKYESIIEPFAGSAGYSVRSASKEVLLIDKDPFVAGTWRYLINVSEEEILSLPDLDPGQSVDDLDICEEARWLIGWYCGRGLTAPRKTQSVWITNYLKGMYHNSSSPCIAWGVAIRERIAGQLSSIRHWQVIEGDYSSAPDVRATWFIDPPYQGKGRHYRCGSKEIDFGDLAEWCKSRLGQVIVCENTGAEWLPFQHFLDAQGTSKVSQEAIWTRETDE